VASESTLTAAAEIAAIVRQLIEKRELLDVSFNQAGDTMKTLLLDADQRRGILVFDAAQDDAINKKIVAASRVNFAGALQGKKIKFSSSAAQRTVFEGSAALSSKFPSALTSVQKRNFYRVRLQSASCVLPVPGRGIARVPVVDISAGGALLLVSNGADGFSLRQVIPGCQIDLGSHGKISCDLEVRRVKLMPNRSAGMGCRFASLSKASEAQLARFVAQNQRPGLARKLLGWLS
jgi:c-di-GMP-binding flagellar brake protein YcgR